MQRTCRQWSGGWELSILTSGHLSRVVPSTLLMYFVFPAHDSSTYPPAASLANIYPKRKKTPYSALHTHNKRPIKCLNGLIEVPISLYCSKPSCTTENSDQWVGGGRPRRTQADMDSPSILRRKTVPAWQYIGGCAQTIDLHNKRSDSHTGKMGSYVIVVYMDKILHTSLQ
jgi:hypothetical protein